MPDSFSNGTTSSDGALTGSMWDIIFLIVGVAFVRRCCWWLVSEYCLIQFGLRVVGVHGWAGRPEVLYKGPRWLKELV